MGCGSASLASLGITGIGKSLPTSRHFEAEIVASLIASLVTGGGGGGDRREGAGGCWGVEDSEQTSCTVASEFCLDICRGPLFLTSSKC
jgi:hypothetical protein